MFMNKNLNMLYNELRMHFWERKNKTKNMFNRIMKGVCKKNPKAIKSRKSCENKKKSDK